MILNALRPTCGRDLPRRGRVAFAVVTACQVSLSLSLWPSPSLAQENAAPAQPRPRALSLAEAQALAVQRSLALTAQTALAEAARHRAVAAGERPDPVLRLGLDNVPVEGGGGSLLTREPTTARSIGVVQALPDATKLASRALAFEREAEQALAQRQLTARSVARESGLAWFGVRAALQRLALIDAQRREAGLAREAADAAYRGGQAAQSDLFAARSAEALLDDQRLQADAQLDVARTRLRRWLGEVADASLADPPPLDRLSPDLDMDDDPELQLAGARERRAAAQADVAREEQRADWSVDLRFQQRGPRFDNMVTLGFSLPLRWDLANRQQRELSARLAQVRQAEADGIELRRARDAELDSWRKRWRTGLARLSLNDRQLQALNEDRVRSALAAYRAGGGTLLSVLAARQAVLGQQLERVQIELETASDWVRLETLTVQTTPKPLPTMRPMQEEAP